VRFDVTDDGYTRLSDKGASTARVAVSWKNQKAFEHDLAQRLLNRQP
jgi:hypothetical protein